MHDILKHSSSANAAVTSGGEIPSFELLSAGFGDAHDFLNRGGFVLKLFFADLSA